MIFFCGGEGGYISTLNVYFLKEAFQPTSRPMCFLICDLLYFRPPPAQTLSLWQVKTLLLVAILH